MVFSSMIFLFRFLPIVFLLYYITPAKYKNFVLAVSSLIFYSWGEVRYLPIILLSAVVDYTASLGIEHFRGNKPRMKLLLAASLVLNLGFLVFFKYTNFVLENINFLFGTSIELLSITLPLGISFLTFQTMSYTIDVYRGDVKAERNIIDFLTYVTMFPQMVAGPIVRFSDVSRELHTRKVTLDDIQCGIGIFVMGLGSKVLIANNIGFLWTEVQGKDFATVSTPLAWLAILAYTLQIYFDFSGYSLMAIGLGRALGFHFPQNFNYPYVSRSVTEFWRRWHMTLGSWFREYLYIPMGGNRCGAGRQYFNLFVTWAATGIWHGASWNFVCWGLFFFVILVIEKKWLLTHLQNSRIWAHVYLLFLVILSWVMFAISDFGDMFRYFQRLFVFQGGNDWVYYLRSYGVTFVLGAVLSTPILSKLQAKMRHNYWPTVVFTIVVLVVSVAYLVDSTYSPFLYFRF